jgi:hypothetical protein
MSTISGTQSLLGSALNGLNLGGTLSTQSTEQGASSEENASTLVSGADQTNLSQMGQLLNQLQQLSTTDSESFKSTAKTIADNLTTQAGQAVSVDQKSALTSLSAKFAAASESGDMSSFTDESGNLGADAFTDTGAGTDTVTISDEGKSLSTQGSSTEEASTDSTATASSSDSSSSNSASSGSAKAGTATASSGGTSNSGKTEDEIDDLIDDKKREIQAAQAKVDQAKAQAKDADTGSDEAKTYETKLSTLNTELAVLQSEKIQAQN